MVDGAVSDLEAARTAMVHDLRRDVRDPRILDAFAAVPREAFIGPELRRFAYADRPLPIGHGQTISQPRMVAIMLQQMAPGPDDKVLDVGTGSGYVAALLSRLAESVISVERVAELANRARATLSRLGCANVAVHAVGDGLGWPEGAPYDAIVVGAASPRVPQGLVGQLGEGGRLVIPVGTRDEQDLIVVVKGPLGIEVQSHGACRFVPLIDAEAFADGADPDL